MDIAATTAVAAEPRDRLDHGATAFNGFFQSQTTTAEALLSGRIEGTGDRGPQLRFKLGGGLGLNSSFGSPAWRVVFSIEMFGQAGPRP